MAKAAIQQADAGEAPMRLRTLEIDSWQLQSAEVSRLRNPAPFLLPPAELRRDLKPGDPARLIFDIETRDGLGTAVLTSMRLWVVVEERLGDVYVGILDAGPEIYPWKDTEGLRPGARIPFKAEHVIEIAG